ncbi:hypothetical protein ACIOD1_33245 [Streptomyces sp. NPDC088097]|uniref:hypothetical protein n=1 Tax=Streptomyces sp. NPDC088097 TaxID=3365823 RepID=UPI0037FA1AFC
MAQDLRRGRPGQQVGLQHGGVREGGLGRGGRATQKRLTGKEEELGEDAEKMAPGWSVDQLRGVLGEDILAELMQGADWPVMARQLVGLQQAGVDLGTFLPQMGRMTAAVHHAVIANAARTKAEGTDRWADLLKATIPEVLVRDAILASPAWPDIAAAMGQLDARGIDVARILLDAHAAGAGVDQAVAAVTTAAAAKAPAPAPAPTATPAPAAPGAVAPLSRDGLASRRGGVDDPWAAPAAGRVPAPAPASAPGTEPAPTPAAAAAPVREGVDPWVPPASLDARRSWGPLTEGLSVPRDLDLGGRPKALEQLGVNRLAHAAIVGVVKDVLPETEAGRLVGSRPWPLLAARMDRIRDQGGTGLLAAHLARLGTDTSWKDGRSSTMVGRLVDATLHSLTTPPSAPAAPASRDRVSPTAARSCSTTPPAAPAPGQQVPTEAAFPPTGSRPHRPGARGMRGDWGGSHTRTPQAGPAGVDGPCTEGLVGAVRPGPDRCRGPLLSGVLLAAAWRAGHLGLAQADFVLTVLGRHGRRGHLLSGCRVPAAARRACGRAADGALEGSPAAPAREAGTGPGVYRGEPRGRGRRMVLRGRQRRAGGRSAPAGSGRGAWRVRLGRGRCVEDEEGAGAGAVQQS